MKKINIDKILRIFLYLIFYVLLAVAIISFCASSTEAEAYYEPTVQFTSIPIKEQIKHDEEIAYQEWLSSHKTAIIECRDCETEYLIEVTEEDIDLMARVVMSEGSTLSFDAKQAIATTIVNRTKDTKIDFKNQNSVKEVVYHKNAYSTEDNGEPTQDCYDASIAALTYEVFPSNMFLFREDYYHTYGQPYMHIGTTFFSTIGDPEYE